MTFQHVLSYGDEVIPYRVNLDPNRTTRVAIHVDPDGSVIVDAPTDRPDVLIHKAVHKRARWIVYHVAEAKDRYRNVRPKSYVSGEQVLYLGCRYMLKVIQSDGANGTAKLKGNRLEVHSKSKDTTKIRAIVRAWYRRKAYNYFSSKLDKHSIILPWVNETPPFRLLEMSKQWGSCSQSGEIILNPNLVKAPRPCIDYVLVHELSHLRHHDHSPKFWKLIDVHAKDWRKAKKQLDKIVEVLLEN